MKIIHIESGLGNQMLSYCEYLAMKKANPNDEVYIENVIFDIPECNEVTCQWNGYELDRIFGINAPNIKSIISSEDWQQFMTEVRTSKFWEKNMNYPVYFTRAFRNIGINVVNTWGDFEQPQFMAGTSERKNPHTLKSKIKKTKLYLCAKAWKGRKPCRLDDHSAEMFISSDENLFAGQKLTFKNKGYGIEKIENEIREVFTFPEITDEKNIQAMKLIEATNSVAIHARRGDLLGMNNYCYVSGYFKRAVNHIRNHVVNPEFFIFCDPGSVEWAKQNEGILGLNFKKDTVRFVDWNKGTESYRDMQLMAACKHQIITNSSFGWWGAWLNTTPDKITCSPEYRINTTITL